jgi:hypothetical protein
MLVCAAMPIASPNHAALRLATINPTGCTLDTRIAASSQPSMGSEFYSAKTG